MASLKIYVDEFGDTGIGSNTSTLFGVSFTFFDTKNDISKEIAKLKK